MSIDPEQLLQGLRPPSPPAHLEQLILGRARQLAGQRASFVDRLWGSRPLRLAWALTVLFLLGTHLWLASSMPSTGPEQELVSSAQQDGLDPILERLATRHRPRAAHRRSGLVGLDAEAAARLWAERLLDGSLQGVVSPDEAQTPEAPQGPGDPA